MKKSILRALEFPHRRGGSDSRHAVGLVIRLVALILLAAVSVQASARRLRICSRLPAAGGLSRPGAPGIDVERHDLVRDDPGGGSSGDGKVFSIGTNGSGFQSLFSFSGTNGARPWAAWR